MTLTRWTPSAPTGTLHGLPGGPASTATTSAAGHRTDHPNKKRSNGLEYVINEKLLTGRSGKGQCGFGVTASAALTFGGAALLLSSSEQMCKTCISIRQFVYNKGNSVIYLN
ncbi:MAG: hypothetical protein A4E20_17960 [Nitrospira sp. SG-bin2]|nr:MAG: hypothetical protein A4E20_17960 [Nitrospira sp. SG-bin2]